MRFPGFEGEWEVKKLGEIATFSKGKGISKSDIAENGLTECIRYGELYTYYGEVINDIKSKTNVGTSNLVLSEVNDVIIPASGETTIDIATASCVLKSGIALGGDLNIIKTENNGVFLSYYLNNKKKMEIANLAQGISVVHLYSSQLATLTLSFPKLEEQNRISTFLALFDARIQTQNKMIEQLETLIKGLSEKIFSQKIRFVEFTGDWKVKRLGEIFYSEKGKGLSKDKLTVNGKYECLLYGELYTKYKEVIFNVVSKTNEEDGLKSQIGDLLIPSSTTTTGIDLANVTAINKENVLLGGDITVLRSKEKINNIFYAYYLSNYKKEEIANYTQGSTIVHLYYNHMKNMEIDFPSLEEQTKIARFLSSIDAKIETEKNILDKYHSQKQYLLQNLFI